MAFNLNLTLKKKSEDSKKSGLGKKLMDDVRVFVALIAVVCIILIVFSVLGVRGINETMEAIETQKTEYRNSQLAIANLKALQSRSSEYEALSAEYSKLIPNTTLDQQTIMIEMETRCDNAGCTLTDIQFAEATSTESVTQMMVTLSVTGDFSKILDLCNEIVTDEEFMRIDAISMLSSGASSSADATNTRKTAQISVVKFAKK